MVTVIKKGSKSKIVIEKFAKHKENRSKSKITSLCGSISLRKDAMELQKEWRDEWK